MAEAQGLSDSTSPLRIFLLCGGLAGENLSVECLAAGLRSCGHEVDVRALGHQRPQARRPIAVVTARIATIADRALFKRGFATPLAHTIVTGSTALRGSYDVIHAFSIPAAQAALLWRRFARGVVVFTSIEPVQRTRLADRRLRLRMTRHACEDSDAVTAATAEAQAALGRWLAMDAPVIDLADVSGYERLYRCLSSPTRRPKPATGS
jgi:hypothetical protein